MTIPAHSAPHRILAFDSGIGGLGIVRALRALDPTLSIDYLADTAVFPYGEQEDTFLVERILTLVSQAIRQLQPQVVVIACNTASTLALDTLRAAWPDMPFIGCVPPIRWAARTTKTHVIGLLATRATIRRPYLNQLQALYAPDCTLIAHAATGLAGCAERLFRGEAVPAETIKQEIAGLFERDTDGQLDTVGLGCTHYTFALEQIRAAAPRHITWLDPAEAVARHTLTVLHTLSDAPAPHSTPQAWFTATPPEPEALEQHLPAFGFQKITLWPSATATEPQTA
ncbi:glutamate racemase [Acetobacter indonesiensis]|uniref:Glutamate racemase n=1 Tax=Acetobacter indonesiensis TaxID=104101 RepID=A0A252AVA4_9PROT|nr:aspartate/glutamate racemase family protein [Acetobacter indonesiensis]OUI94393.1 glutamate racemase [Acetobacter indonesiensis]